MEKNRKVAIITGAGSGIGRAISIALCKKQWCVVLAGRREDTLIQTSKECDEERALVVPTDLNNPESIKNLFEQTISVFSRLDLLINNAGISGSSKSLEELSLEEWQNIISTNLTGAFLCTQAAFKIMKHQNPIGGRIINNGSISAHVPRPNSAPYTASKHAITGLTKSTSLDGRTFHIACGQIDIGNATSAMTKKMGKGVLQADGAFIIEPTIDVKAIVDAVVYMSSLPLEANVPFMTVMANQMPYMGRG